MTLGPYHHNLIYLPKGHGIYVGEGGSFWAETTYGRLSVLALWGCKKDWSVPSDDTLVDAVISADADVLKRIGKVSVFYFNFKIITFTFMLI